MTTTIRSAVPENSADDDDQVENPVQRGRHRHQTFTVRSARWSATHPKSAVLIWFLFIALTFMLSAAFGTRQATNSELLVGEAATAAETVSQAGMNPAATENVLITARSGTFDQERGLQVAAQVTADLQSLPDVATVNPPLVAASGDAVLVGVTMAGDADTAADRVAGIQDSVSAVATAHPDLLVEQAGSASIKSEFTEWLGKDIEKASTISVPVTLIILLVAFGAIVMAGIPVLLAISSVASALGLWAVASQLLPDPGMVAHVIVLMGMAVGVDYSLFYLKRFREEYAAGRDKVDAVAVAAATSGHSIVVSGVAVVVCMAGLYLAQDVVFSAMATGAILVVLVALVSSVTVLPAMLVTLARWVDRPRVPLVWRLSSKPGNRIVTAVLMPVLRRPVLGLIGSMTVLLALAAPAIGMSLKSTQIEDFPRTLSTMQTYDRIVAAFPATETFDTVVLSVPGDGVEQLPVGVDRVQAAVAADPLFAGEPDIQFAQDGRTAVLTVATPFASDDPQAKESVRVLREVITPAAVGDITGVQWAVGGDVASDLDYTANLGQKLPLVVGIVLLLTFLIMLRSFRSLVVAGVTVLLNLLSAAAAFGVLCLVFQHHWADSLLGYTATGHIVSWVPMLLFVVLSGLSLDYHVFVVSRIREDVYHGMTTRNAVASGVIRSAGVVTSAAVVMIAVFAIFGTLSFIELKQIGVGLAVAIALDATVIRLVALPSLLVLFGERAWWPGRRSSAEFGRAASADSQPPVSAPDDDVLALPAQTNGGRP